MKINNFIAILLTTSLLLAYVSASQKEKENALQDVEIKPRVAHIQDNFTKLVKPLVDRPFLPEEVDKLASLKKRKIFHDNSMATAEIIGQPQNFDRGAVEKPSIYTSVFQNHKTSVIHPVPQKIGIPLPNKAAQFAFSSEAVKNERNILTEQISRELSIPVNLGSIGRSDPTLKGYETPQYQKNKNITPSEENSFLETGKKHKSATSFAEMSPEDSLTLDIKTFLKQFENSKDKADKQKIIMDGKARLYQHAKEIKDSVSSYLDELLDAKKLAIRLNNLVHKYEAKALDDQKAQNLKLSDQITIKEILRDKIHREVQGLRVSPTQYAELEQANPADIERISLEVANRLGPY